MMRYWRQASLRLRLIVSTAVVTSLVLALLAVTLYVSMRAALLNDFDQALRTGAESLAALTEMHDDHFVFEGEPSKMMQFAPGPEAEYFKIVLPDGHVLAQSPSLMGRELEMNGGPQRARFVKLPSGEPGRLLVYRFMPRVEVREGKHEEAQRAAEGDPMPTHRGRAGEARVVLARPTRELDGTTASLRRRLIGLGASAVGLCAALMTLIVGRGMRPVSELARQIGAVGEENLDRPIELEEAPPELAPVVGRLNDLLHRLGAALEREKSFSADVAHELRTPLAGVQTALEVSATQARAPEQYRRTIGECLKVIRQMGGMVENLLMLARMESGQVHVGHAAIDVTALLMEAWVGFADRAAARGLKVEWALPEEVMALSDGEKLLLVFRNLLDNAVSYADRGGTILISAAVEGGKVRVEVANSGCTLTESELEQVFNRFWRADRARNDGGGHHGLGLALCRRIVSALGGSLTARLPQAGWVAFEVGMAARRGAGALAAV